MTLLDDLAFAERNRTAAGIDADKVAYVRRALAIAQAVDLWDAEVGNGTMLYTADLRTLADELLRGQP